MPPPPVQSFIVAAEESLKTQNLEEAIKQANLAKDTTDQLLATYQIHIAAQKRINGFPDWYDVLGIEDTYLGTEAIKSSYKKLALKFHPDKNPSAAADGAFKIVSQAWDVLSDPSSRKVYDKQRGTLMLQDAELWPKPSKAGCGTTGASNSQVPPNNAFGPANGSGASTSQNQAPPNFSGGAESWSGPPNFTPGTTYWSGARASNNQVPPYGAAGASELQLFKFYKESSSTLH